MLALVAAAAAALAAALFATPVAARPVDDRKAAAPAEPPPTPAAKARAAGVAGAVAGAGATFPSSPCAPRTLPDLLDALDDTFAGERERLGRRADATSGAASHARLDAAVRALVGGYLRRGVADWRDAAAAATPHAGGRGYARHLVGATADFEAVLIVWGSGASSAVHSHADSHCWLTVAQGVAEERTFAVPRAGCDALVERAGCPALRPLGARALAAGDSSYISDAVALHSVHSDAGAVSLHVYAPPIRRYAAFAPGEGRVELRVPGFSTTGAPARWSPEI